MFPLTREAKNPVKSLIKSKTEKFANSVVFKLYLSSYWDCVNCGVKRPRGPVVKKLDNAIHALNRYDVNTRIIIIIIFNIYIAQINIQEDMIKCALHIKIESKLLCYLFTILNLQ